MAQIMSGASSDILTVDAVSKAGRFALYDLAGNPLAVQRAANTPSIPTGIPIAGMNDNTWRIQRLDRMGNTRVGFDNLLLHDDVEGATVNTQLWTQSLTTFTQAQVATTGINMNSGSGSASGSASILTSQKQFSKMQLSPLRVRFRLRNAPQTNSIHEFGFGAPSGTTAQIPTGAFWRYTSTGTVVPVLAYNNSDVVQGVDCSSVLNSANYYTWGIIVDDDSVIFTCQNTATGQVVNEQILQMPLAQPRMFSVTHLPTFARIWTSGACASAPLMFVSDACVVGLDMFVNKPWAHQLACASAGGGELLPTTFAQAENGANSTAPTSATLSNTAAGYTSKGGKFQFAAVAGAETDYCLFGFQSPAPYTFVCTGIQIDTYNTVVAVATTNTLLEWQIANNSSAVSLATAGLLRTSVGIQNFAIGAAVGASANTLSMNFDAPLRTDSGRYLQVILRMPLATATATEIFRGQVTLKGYSE